MTEFELLMTALSSYLGSEQTKKCLEQFKAVVTANSLDRTPNILRDMLRLTELSFNPQRDKHYGKY